MKCVILAAGEGKRLRPLTANRPKVMVPVANKPILEHLILAAKDAGIREFVVVVGYGSEHVRTYFGDGSTRGIFIKYVHQSQQLGTGDALLRAAEEINDRFLLLNGDMIVRSSDISSLLKMEAPCMATFNSTHPEDYGTITLTRRHSRDMVASLEEKSPQPRTTLVNAGAYLLDPDIFTHLSSLALSHRHEYELTDALAPYVNMSLFTYMLSLWLDIGYPWDLLDANALLLESITPQNEGTIEENVVIKGNVKIGKDTVIHSGTYILGNCVIGRNCDIGPHAFLRENTAIGNYCHVGHATEVKNSILMFNSNAPHFNYIGDSIIGSGCNLGAGTKIANIRHDKKIVKVEGVNTRRMKFGAIIGDNVHFGINCSINTGTVISSNSRIAPHTYLNGIYGEGTII